MLPARTHSPSRSILLSLSATVLLAAAAPVVQAQSLAGMRRGSDLSTFIASSGVTPDYFPGHAMGITAGADWTRFYSRRLAVSFEVRGNRTSSNQLVERSITFGPRIITSLGTRYHPYADYLFGGGSITFLNNSAPPQDPGIVKSFGGGIDIDLTRSFSTRIDYQSQSWHIDNTRTADVTFAPNLLSVGLEYHIPFKPRLARTY